MQLGKIEYMIAAAHDPTSLFVMIIFLVILFWAVAEKTIDWIKPKKSKTY